MRDSGRVRASTASPDRPARRRVYTDKSRLRRGGRVGRPTTGTKGTTGTTGAASTGPQEVSTGAAPTSEGYDDRRHDDRRGPDRRDHHHDHNHAPTCRTTRARARRPTAGASRPASGTASRSCPTPSSATRHPRHGSRRAAWVSSTWPARRAGKRPHRSNRASLDEPFVVGKLLAAWPGLNFGLDHPSLLRGDAELILAGRPGFDDQLFVATWNGSLWSAPVPMTPPIATLLHESIATFTEDGGRMIFQREDGPPNPDLNSASWRFHEASPRAGRPARGALRRAVGRRAPRDQRRPEL
jgi:hypothetical protein